MPSRLPPPCRPGQNTIVSWVRQARTEVLPGAAQHMMYASTNRSPVDADQLWLVSNAFSTGLQRRRSWGQSAPWQGLETSLCPVRILSCVILTQASVYTQVRRLQMPLHTGSTWKSLIANDSLATTTSTGTAHSIALLFASRLLSCTVLILTLLDDLSRQLSRSAVSAHCTD